MTKKLPIEAYFLKYAFPCAFITLQRGRISRKTYDDLEKAAVKSKVVPRDELEKIFVPAFRRMRKLAQEKKMDLWSHELMQEYYWKRHNELIDAGIESYEFAPEVLKNLCKVLPAKVVETGKKGVIVQFKNKQTRPVMTDLVGKLKEGDQVMVHYGYAVEKI